MLNSKRLLAGASGYSYKEWKGVFYPESIKPDAMLAWYGERLPTVEINNTFYRMPKVSVLENWAKCTPAHFRFGASCCPPWKAGAPLSKSWSVMRRYAHAAHPRDLRKPAGYVFQHFSAARG